MPMPPLDALDALLVALATLLVALLVALLDAVAPPAPVALAPPLPVAEVEVVDGLLEPEPVSSVPQPETNAATARLMKQSVRMPRVYAAARRHVYATCPSWQARRERALPS